MDVVSATSGVFAVVSLAIQLVGTIDDVSRFLRNIRGAPAELASLCESLDQMRMTLDQAHCLLEQQFLVLRLPGSPEPIAYALGNCKKRIKGLEDFVKDLKKSSDRRHRASRVWASFRMVSKKEDIQHLQNQLRDATTNLQCAMMSNSWQLQYPILFPSMICGHR